ncbi:MAG: hypothetical protein ACQEP8_00455 [Chlamydiota bacterium]
MSQKVDPAQVHHNLAEALIASGTNLKKFKVKAHDDKLEIADQQQSIIVKCSQSAKGDYNVEVGISAPHKLGTEDVGGAPNAALMSSSGASDLKHPDAQISYIVALLAAYNIIEQMQQNMIGDMGMMAAKNMGTEWSATKDAVNDALSAAWNEVWATGISSVGQIAGGVSSIGISIGSVVAGPMLEGALDYVNPSEETTEMKSDIPENSEWKAGDATLSEGDEGYTQAEQNLSAQIEDENGNVYEYSRTGEDENGKPIIKKKLVKKRISEEQAKTQGYIDNEGNLTEAGRALIDNNPLAEYNPESKEFTARRPTFEEDLEAEGFIKLFSEDKETQKIDWEEGDATLSEGDEYTQAQRKIQVTKGDNTYEYSKGEDGNIEKKFVRKRMMNAKDAQKRGYLEEKNGEIRLSKKGEKLAKNKFVEYDSESKEFTVRRPNDDEVKIYKSSRKKAINTSRPDWIPKGGKKMIESISLSANLANPIAQGVSSVIQGVSGGLAGYETLQQKEDEAQGQVDRKLAEFSEKTTQALEQAGNKSSDTADQATQAFQGIIKDYMQAQRRIIGG